MALNTFKCNHMTPLHFKGLIRQLYCLCCMVLFVPAVQLTSSDPSPQSLSVSHTYANGMQRRLSHVNWSGEQVGNGATDQHTVTYQPHVNNVFSSRAFSVSAPTVWNLLQSETRLSHTYVTFRNRLETELLQKSYDTWHWRHRCAPDSHATCIWAR